MKKKRVAWNKGLTKETDERVAKYSNSRIGKKCPSTTLRNLLNNPMKDIKVRKKSSETKKLKFKKGETKIWNKGKTVKTEPRINKYLRWGKNNHNWKGNADRSKYHKKARKLLNVKGFNNIVDHKDNNFKNNALINLKIMTRGNHTSLHKKNKKRVQKK